MSIKTFLDSIESILRQGNATEHSYRPALKMLFESVIPGATATNEPKRKHGSAPDFELVVNNVPIGYVEAKDPLTVDIGKVIVESDRDNPKHNGEQLKRYRALFSNLLYTDGLKWYWFVEGELRFAVPVQVATWDSSKKKLRRSKTADEDLTKLLTQFAEYQALLVGTPHDLARRLAQVARWLADDIQTVLKEESDQGTLHQQFEAFQHTLLPNIKNDEFADMYAQTIVYGLFAARAANPNRKNFSRADAALAIPKTNPFLRKLFYYIAGIDLDTRIEWLVDHCADLLARTDMAEVLRDFGKATKQEDPVVHFYETFLAAYDPKTREMRGVYYTPEPVVSYIVRSVDLLLRHHFNKNLGLADSDTIILDPATGTATFLHAVVQHIYATLQQMGIADAWNQYVPDQLLPRLFGFELLMAPYTIAHLKLSLLLQQLGYTFERDERLGVYLTNALSDAPTGQQSLPFAQFIAEEGTAADAVKHEKPVMVVLGNPPYSGHSANLSPWMDDLLHGNLPDGTSTESYYDVDGHPLGERNSKWLQDDYVKFIRFGQWRIQQTGEGVLAFISNHGYLNNPTFRGMRESLLKEFDTIYLLNLHGNSMQRERSPDGSPDDNVFDIQQGVAIGFFVKQGTSCEHATVYYADVWGKRAEKYTYLMSYDIGTSPWQQVLPSSPWYLFVPQDTKLQAEYEQGWSIPDIFPINSVGIVTARDYLTVQWTKKEMRQIIQHFTTLSIDEARTTYHIGDDTKEWTITSAQSDIRQHGISPKQIVPLLYRPFDTRYTYYTGQTKGFICRPRFDVMHHMLDGKNIGMIFMRQVAVADKYTHIFVSDALVDNRAFYSNKGIMSYAPLYLYPNGHEHPSLFDHENGRRPNMSTAFIKDIEQRLHRSFIPDGTGDLDTTIGPEDIFHYIYAIFHSPTYRSRYAEFLKIDFPRIPITSDNDLFNTLVAYGAALVDLHLLRTSWEPGQVGGAGGAEILRNPKAQGITQRKTTAAPIEKITYYEAQHRVNIGADMYFAGIAPDIWTMQLGGYHPLQKWLKDRKGRTLSLDDTLHYMQMVIALRETQRMMQEIDAAIPEFPLA